MNYHKIEAASIENGLGFRVVLWVAGCEHHCGGCHNPETWDYDGGKPFDGQAMQALLDALEKEWVAGVTLTGGDPMAPENRDTVIVIIQTIRELLPDKNIWLYTGYQTEIEDYTNHRDKHSITRLCDVVVDGAYVEELRDITLPWRGSSNQRVIDVKKTILNGQIELLQTDAE